MIHFDHVHKMLGGQVILGDVDFKVEQGSFTTIFGPNGCGKSTLMSLLCGLTVPTSGQIKSSEKIQDKIGFVFQDYRRHLLPWKTARENIFFPLKLRGISDKECHRKLDQLVERFDLHLPLDQHIFTMSGGQAQMVSLLRAVMIKPKVLILDEPFSALDYVNTLGFRQKLMEIALALDLTTIFISHDLEEALYLGDQVVFFSAKPTKVRTILKVPFARPRGPELLGNPDFAALMLKALDIVLN